LASISDGGVREEKEELCGRDILDCSVLRPVSSRGFNIVEDRMELYTRAELKRLLSRRWRRYLYLRSASTFDINIHTRRIIPITQDIDLNLNNAYYSLRMAIAVETSSESGQPGAHENKAILCSTAASLLTYTKDMKRRGYSAEICRQLIMVPRSNAQS
jgi:hypothetical protein